MSVLSNILTYWYINHHQLNIHGTRHWASVLEKSVVSFLFAISCYDAALLSVIFWRWRQQPCLKLLVSCYSPWSCRGEIAQFCRENCLSEFIQLARELSWSVIGWEDVTWQNTDLWLAGQGALVVTNYPAGDLESKRDLLVLSNPDCPQPSHQYYLTK